MGETGRECVCANVLVCVLWYACVFVSVYVCVCACPCIRSRALGYAIVRGLHPVVVPSSLHRRSLPLLLTLPSPPSVATGGSGSGGKENSAVGPDSGTSGSDLELGRLPPRAAAPPPPPKVVSTVDAASGTMRTVPVRKVCLDISSDDEEDDLPHTRARARSDSDSGSDSEGPADAHTQAARRTPPPSSSASSSPAPSTRTLTQPPPPPAAARTHTQPPPPARPHTQAPPTPAKQTLPPAATHAHTQAPSTPARTPPQSSVGASPEGEAAFLAFSRGYASVRSPSVPRDAWFEIRDPASRRMYYLNTVTGASNSVRVGACVCVSE